MEPSKLLAVFLGGGLGATARYLVGQIFAMYLPITLFPWPTFLVNMLGSFALGIVMLQYKEHPQPLYWLLMGTGICGGFTTFSTFSLETMLLLQRERYLLAASYAFGSVFLGVALAAIAVNLLKKGTG